MMKLTTLNEYEISLPIQFHGYKVIRMIENGSTCVVVLVEKIKTKEKFAAKIISKKNAREMEILQSINNEIKILKTLNHPNIIKIYEFFQIKNDEQEELVVIITEYCQNGTLLDYANKKSNNELEKKKIFIKIIKAIKYLHDHGIAHGDIKGDNILLDKHLEPKLCDFGFAHLKEIEGDESKNGTLHYSAPELHRHGKFNTLKADIYSIGILMYSINELHFPFKNGTPEKYEFQIKNGLFSIREGVDEQFRQIFVKCTNMNPNQRPRINDLIEDPYFSEAILHILIDQKKYQEFEFTLISYCKLLIKSNIKKIGEIKESIFKIYENIIVLNSLKGNMKNDKTYFKENFDKLKSMLHPYIQKYSKPKKNLKTNYWMKGNQYERGRLNKYEYSRNKISGVRYWKKHFKALNLN